MTYSKGLHEVADGVHAYLQPDGTWGWSNAGLIRGDGESVLIDTLFDLRLTAAMLDEMAPITGAAPVRSLVNTHANGDHCYGNQLVASPDVDIVSSKAAAAEMDETPPAVLAAMMAARPNLPDDLAAYLTHAFGPFEFEGIDSTPPTSTFTGRHTVQIAGATVELIEVGPAHTAGDVVAWATDQRVLFAGDILFIGGTPIIWAGPVGNWIKACDTIIELDPAVVVPGHGPLTDLDGVRSVRDYLSFLDAGTRSRHAAGLTVEDAWRDLDRELDDSPYAGWTDRERIVVNVNTLWRHLEPETERPNVFDLFGTMAEYFALGTRGSSAN